MYVHGANHPSTKEMVTFITANRTITATTVDVSLSSAASNPSSRMIGVRSSNACWWNGFPCAAFVARCGSHLTLQRHLIYSCARSRGNLFILNHLGCAPTVVEPPPPLLRGGWFHFGQRVRARLLVARVMELLNVKLEA